MGGKSSKEIFHVNHQNYRKMVEAAENGMLQDLLDLLKQSQVNVNVVPKGSDLTLGELLLFPAATNGHANVVTFLTLEEGVSINRVYSDDRLTALIAAAETGRLNCVEVLISAGANLNFQSCHGAALHVAAAKGFADVVRLLCDKGAAINSLATSHSETPVAPIHLAADEGRSAVVAVLIQKGARIDITDRRGSTPMHFAAAKGNVDIVRQLFEAGASVNSADKKGQTALHFAAKLPNLETVAYICQSTDAAVNAVDEDGWTPLFAAARFDRLDNVELLLNFGADTTLLDKQGRTAAAVAQLAGNIAIFDYLEA